MDAGSSIAIFFVLLAVLMALFCILTRYFHHKLVENIQEVAQLNSVADQQLPQQTLSEEQMGYQKFKEVEMQKIFRNESKKKIGYDQLQMPDLKVPFNTGDAIYSPNILKRKLNNEITPIKRSMSSMKQLQLDKINTTNRSGKSTHEIQGLKRLSFKAPADNHDQQLTQHTFINKLVSYDSQCLTVVQINVSSICKLGDGSFLEKKNVKIQTTSSNEKNFQDQLQVFGFEQGDFGCYKYLTRVEIQNMKLNEDYAIKSLKTCEIKESMEIEDYIRMKIQLSSSL